MEKVKLVVLLAMLFASQISALLIESVAAIVAVPTLAYLHLPWRPLEAKLTVTSRNVAQRSGLQHT